MSAGRADARRLAGWVTLVLAGVVVLSCGPAGAGQPGPGTPSPLPTFPPLGSPLPTFTTNPAHATANTLLLTAVSLERNGDLGAALAAAGTALVVGTAEPADARVASSFLTRAPGRATFAAAQAREVALTGTALAENPPTPRTTPGAAGQSIPQSRQQ
jgi:hypothetical protein